MNPVQESLSRSFAKHRLVFWYDEAQEWKKEYESFQDPKVEKHEIQNNEFGLKVKVLTEASQKKKFLFYSGSAQPENEKNWLLDLVLQGHEFRADRTSLHMQEIEAPFAMRRLFEEHETFLANSKHKKALKGSLSAEDDEDAVRLKMMATLVNAEPEIESILLRLISEALQSEMMDPAQLHLEEPKLLVPFWDLVKKQLGYSSNTPSIIDFVVTLFRAFNPLENGPKLKPQCKVLLQRWKDSKEHNESFRAFSKKLAEDLQIETQLKEASGEPVLGESDLFEIFERFEIHRLVGRFKSGEKMERVQETLQMRRQSCWFPQHEAGYLAVVEATRMRDLIAELNLAFQTFDDGFRSYTTHWWRVDQAYRKCRSHLTAYNQQEVMAGVGDWLETTYLNEFLQPLSDQWSDTVEKATEWHSPDLEWQRDFFEKQVHPLIQGRLKLVVIISDALRYEAAQEFAARLENENRFTAKTTAMQGILPSYTQLGMAALLPGSSLSVTPESGLAQRDGFETSGSENRLKTCNRHLPNKVAVLTSNDFASLNTKTDGRQLMADNDLLIVYHNTIDKTGDDKTKEAYTFEAVEQAFAELLTMVKKAANINFNNILVTADHGFIFQAAETHKSTETPRPKTGEISNTNRRFIIGQGLKSESGIHTISAQALGLEGDYEVSFPKSLGRFPLQGSGKRFVHGGYSLQEVVIPVIRINKARTDDVSQVAVEVLRLPQKITTGSLRLSLFQTDAVSTKRQPRRLGIRVAAQDDTEISELKYHDFDSESEEPRDREISINLMLGTKANQYHNQQVKIQLLSTVPKTSQEVVYESYSVLLYKPFENDFDDV